VNVTACPAVAGLWSAATTVLVLVSDDPPVPDLNATAADAHSFTGSVWLQLNVTGLALVL
jgi:hypothetical protein